MNHALAGHSSQRSREHRDIEAAAGEAGTPRGSHAVFDFTSQPPRGQPSGPVEEDLIGIDPDDETRRAGHFSRQPALAAAYIQNARVVECNAAPQRANLGALGIPPVPLHSSIE